MKQMVGYGVKHSLGRLRARCVVKENKVILQRGKRSANVVYGELCHGPNDTTCYCFRRRPCRLPSRRSSAHHNCLPHSRFSRSCFFKILPPGLRGKVSERSTRYCGTLKSA